MSEIPVWSPRCLPAGSTPIQDRGVSGWMDLIWVMCSLKGTPACTYSWVIQRVLCWSSDAKRTTVGARIPKSMPAMACVIGKPSEEVGVNWMGCLSGGDVLAHGFDFDREVVVGRGVEVSDGDDACEGVGFVGVVDDGDVSDFAVGHEVTDFGECGVWGAVDDILGHRFGDWGGRGVELGGDDAGEDVAFGDDACDFVE